MDVSPAAASQLRRLIQEKARRQRESLRLFEPLPSQQRFLKSQAHERLARGSNQSGKTLTAGFEVARAVTGNDPKYPSRGICFCVAKDGGRIGDVVWRTLARPGAFKVIKDPISGQYRAFRPFDPADLLVEHLAQPAEPMIPPRYIKDIGWTDKKSSCPSVVILHSGWEIHFFSSLGKPPQGSKIDLGWFDEEIFDSDWYPEVSARLMARKGRFIWSATPQAGTEQLYRLHEIAEEEYGKPHPRIEEFLMLLEENPHIGQDEKQIFASKMTDEEYRIRVRGEFALLAFKVFPEFEKDMYEVDPFTIPPTWTRYKITDPGRQVCAVLFAAVPPDEDAVYLYDELYLKNCSADMYGREVAVKTRNQQFWAFVIDHQGGRHTEAGSGRTIEDQYSEALRRYKIACETSGCAFTWGSPDKKAGVEAVRDWLRIRGSGKPKLRILRDRLPNFCREMKHFRYKKTKEGPNDDPVDRGDVHLMACARYLALYGPRYHKMPVGKRGATGALAAYQAKQKKKDKTRSINLGPSERAG
jgi:hypothetical protein